MGKWCEYHQIPWHNIEECLSKQSLVAELKSSDSKANFEYEPNQEIWKWIIYVEPTATVTTTKFQPNELEEIEEGECLFHSQM
jgi:hypothetical protein